MRYALVSDIHANLQAWNAVLLDIRSARVDRILCLGDIVGYGPNPAEVLQSVHAHVDHILLGNHDAAIAGKLSPELFNPGARRMISWTAERMGPEAVRFLGGLPMVLDAGMFRCTHGEFSDPASFRYLIEPADAAASWEAASNPLLFAGHTHRPRIFLRGNSGRTHCIDPVDFEMEGGKRYLVNVGSVGQPRDGRVLASYCIFDAARRAVFWRDIPFDIDAFREAREAAGLSEEAAGFLRHDPRRDRPPLRSLIDFSPARTESQRVRNVREVASIAGLTKRVRRWRATALLAGLGVPLLAGGLGALAWRGMRQGRVIPPPEIRTGVAADAPADASLVGIPVGPVAAGEPVEGWFVALGRRRRQSVEVLAPEKDAPGAGRFRIVSETPGKALRVRSARIRVRPGMKFRAEGFFLPSADFTGSLGLVVRFFDEQGRIRKRVINPNLVRRNGWRKAQRTFETPSGCRALDLAIEGDFAGEARVRDVSLRRLAP